MCVGAMDISNARGAAKLPWVRERVLSTLAGGRPPSAPPGPPALVHERPWFDTPRSRCSRRARLRAAFLCPLHANIYGIEFLSFVITDFDSKKTIFEVAHARPLADRETERDGPARKRERRERS